MSDDEHARLAPSSAHRWSHCAGSVQLQEKYPDLTPESEPAREGTAAHWVAEAAADLEAPRVVVGTVAPNGVIVTQDMLDGAKMFNDDIAAKVCTALSVTKDSPRWKAGGAHREFKVFMPSIHPDNWGTLDAGMAIAKHDTIYVWDYKYGYGLVEAKGNMQCIDYLVGLLDYIKREHNVEPKHIEIRIVQPRGHHPSGKKIRSWRIPVAELSEYVATLADKAAEATGPNPICNTAPHACKNCSARHTCPALNAACMHILDVSERAIPMELDGLQLGKQLAELKYAQDLLKARVSGLEVQAESMIRGGKGVPGWRMTPGQAKLVWIKPAAEIVALGSLMGVDLSKDDTITPTQAKAAFKAAKLPAEMVDAYAERKTPALKLVPEDNDRVEEVMKNGK